MTPEEKAKVERELILDILIESTKWHIDNDVDDAIRLEVCLRAKKLFTGKENLGDNGLIQSVVERGLARQQAKNKNTHVGQVRVCINGKPKWFPQDMCMQIPFPKSKTKLKWVLKDGVGDVHV
jgi:hypothetical protein